MHEAVHVMTLEPSNFSIQDLAIEAPKMPKNELLAEIIKEGYWDFPPGLYEGFHEIQDESVERDLALVTIKFGRMKIQRIRIGFTIGDLLDTSAKLKLRMISPLTALAFIQAVGSGLIAPNRVVTTSVLKVQAPSGKTRSRFPLAKRGSDKPGGIINGVNPHRKEEVDTRHAFLFAR